MKNKNLLILLPLVLIMFAFGFSYNKFDKKTFATRIIQDTIKADTLPNDSIIIEGNYSYKLYKKNAHASYYAKKFDGKRTASGAKFYNNKLTAAHRKLPFGTLLRITNERNKKQVVVTVNDRGPFVKGREIDLSRRAFMEITSNKGGGETNVTIEVMKKK